MSTSFTWRGKQPKEKASWSYSGFGDFREKLAAMIGINLQDMDGFSNRRYGKPDYKAGTKTWDGITDPIVFLLNHSDCEGELTPEQCLVSAPRLVALVESWDDDDYDKWNALLLADHMKECVRLGVKLEFC